VLYIVESSRPACHTGQRSCFHHMLIDWITTDWIILASTINQTIGAITWMQSESRFLIRVTYVVFLARVYLFLWLRSAFTLTEYTFQKVCNTIKIEELHLKGTRSPNSMELIIILHEHSKYDWYSLDYLSTPHDTTCLRLPPRFFLIELTF
jgi:hypothetical protein